MVAGFIRGLWVHCGASQGSSGSSWVAGYIGLCPGGRRVHQVSLGYSLLVFELIQGRQIHLGSLGCSLGIVGFIRCRWVHFGSSGIAGFIGMLPVDRRVDLGYLGSLVTALGVVGFIRGRWVHSFRPWGSPGSSGFAGFI